MSLVNYLLDLTPSSAALTFYPPIMMTIPESPYFHLPSLSTLSTLLYPSALNRPLLVTLLSYSHFNLCTKIFPSHSAPALLTGRWRQESSPIKATFMFPPMTPFTIPSLPTAMIMNLPDTPASSKPASLSPPSSGGQASPPLSANMLKAVWHASKTRPTPTPPYVRYHPFSWWPLAPSSRFPVISSPISPFLPASILSWSWSTMALLRG